MHDNWKQAIVAAAETDTRVPQPLHVARRCGRCAPTAPSALEPTTEHNGWASSATPMDLYFGGDMEASIALSGQVAGRIDSVRPVADIIESTVAEFIATVDRLSSKGVPA